MAVRIGFIGCGNHARTNLYPSLRYADCELVAVADLYEVHREYCVRHFGARRQYADYRALLDGEAGEIDAVIVCGPPALHLEAGRAALERGLPVMTEKPPAPDYAGTLVLQAAARANGKLCATGFMKRYAQKYVAAKRIVESVGFGGMTHCSMKYSFNVKLDPHATLALMGVHAIDLMRHFMGEPERVTVERRDWGGNQSVSLLYAFRSGATGSLVMNATSPVVTERLELTGEGAMVVVDEVAGLLHVPAGQGAWSAPVGEVRFNNWALQTDENQSLVVQGYVGEIRAFVEAVKGTALPEGGTIDDAVAAMFQVDGLSKMESGTMEFD